MEWVASTLHITSEHGVSRITTADAHPSAASSRLNWRPRRFKWTRPFRRKTKSVFCACAITFQTQSTSELRVTVDTAWETHNIHTKSISRRVLYGLYRHTTSVDSITVLYWATWPLCTYNFCASFCYHSRASHYFGASNRIIVIDMQVFNILKTKNICIYVIV